MSTTNIDIAIVGLGSRGLSILERCFKHIEQTEYEKWNFHLHLIEPQVLGVGLHNPSQPDYLLLNTICSQISMFPDAIALGNNLSREGLDLYRWTELNGYKLHKDGYTVSCHGERDIQPTDHLPRKLLGEYLSWFYHEITREIPKNASIQHYTQLAIDILPERKHEIVILEDGTNLKADFVFITTGHTSIQIPSTPRTLSPYPLPQNLKEIKPGEAVAISGFGLSSMDIIASLTVGRGGKYQNGKYIPSGQEPLLLLYSRSGVPFRVRPLFDRKSSFEPVIFSSINVEIIKTAKKFLNYEQHIKPLVLLEICCRYYLQHEYLQNGWDAATLLHKELCTAYEKSTLSKKLEIIATTYGAFNIQEVLYPNIKDYLQDSESYQKRILQIIWDDLNHAQIGIHNSPLKTALETFRDLRDVIRYIVDWGGLSDESHKHFMKYETALMNRTVIGPQKERHQEIIALLKARVISIPCGPQPQIRFNGRCWELSSTKLKSPNTILVNWLIQGYSESPTLKDNNSELIQTLVDSGRLNPFRAYCQSANVDRNYQPLDKKDSPQKRLWILGPLLEGTTFYNHYIPSPFSPNRAIREAHQCVSQLFNLLPISESKSESIFTNSL